jgi:hypothetical protein
MPAWVITQPIAGELAVTSVSPEASLGQSEQVLSWAQSVADHRFPNGRGKSGD